MENPEIPNPSTFIFLLLPHLSEQEKEKITRRWNILRKSANYYECEIEQVSFIYQSCERRFVRLFLKNAFLTFLISTLPKIQFH